MTDFKNLGLSIMGSKRRLAPTLITEMVKNHIEKYQTIPVHFIDGFGGGGAMSFSALNYGFLSVTYNELNTAIVTMLQHVQKNRKLTHEFYEWVGKEDFDLFKRGDDIQSGICQSFYSFGGNQKDYSFGKQELMLSEFHALVADSNQDILNEWNQKHNKNIPLKDPNKLFETLRDRKLRFKKAFFKKGCRHGEQFERIAQLEKICCYPRFQQLNLINGSFDELVILTPPNETIVYFDPPYQNTRKYNQKHQSKGNDLNKKVFDYMAKSEYTIYLSEYESPFEEIYSVKHRNQMNQRNKGNKPTIEKLFVNKGKI